jgi:hypothetical protein
MRKALLAFSLLLLASGLAFGGAGGSGAAFLKLPVDARAVAMGEAFTAQAQGATSLYWNPAGLAKVPRFDLAAMHNVYLMSTFQDYAAGAYTHPSWGSFGLSLNYWGSGSISGTDSVGNSTGSFSANDLAVTGGYARKVGKNMSLGLGLKFISEKNENASGTAFALDLGGLYEIPAQGLVLGASVSNLGSQMKLVEKGYPLPLTFRAGGAYALPKLPLRFAADLTAPNDGSVGAGLGTEYLAAKRFALRAGYRSGSDLHGLSGLRAGAGFVYQGFGLDYAFTPYGELGMTHRVSLSFHPVVPLP